MSGYIQLYQHLPEHINPNITFGFFSISWYSIMYLVAFFVVYLLVRYRINKAEYEGLKIPNDKLQIPNKIQISKSKMESLLLDFLLYAFIGLIIGARLGEVFFYNFSYYSANPLMIISPFDPVTHKFIGIYGMSYHGGLIGVAVTAWIWARKNNINLLSWGNLIAPAIPAGYFFGRIGNFINGELYGRPTSTWWGMYFPSDPTGQLRHPSQLYEAFLEGILLFFILWPIRRKYWARNNMLVLYLSGYAVARITSEFFREPDGLIGFLTLGQFYSLLTLLAAFLVFLNTRKSDIIKERKEIKNNSEEF